MIISKNQTVILGAPGCGKTTALLHLVDECFKSGVKPHEVAFVSFSKRAATEALERACSKFGFTKAQLPFFRTLHSLAFHQLGLRSNEVMSAQDYNKLGKLLKAPFSMFTQASTPEVVADFYSEKKGDYMLFLDALARSRMQDISDTYHTEHNYKVGKHEFIRFAETYEEFRRHHNLLDFTDMLHSFVSHGMPVNVKVAFIDEAQDLSKLQWEVCKVAFTACERVVIAGDDDQAIFKWAGADIESFLALGGTKVVLTKSHRLPVAVHDFAQRIILQVPKRFEKDFSPRPEPGILKKFKTLESLPFEKEGNWLWLGRNTSALADFERVLRAKSIPYMTKHGSSIKIEHTRAIQAWEALRSGKSLLPRDIQICLDYIKGAKKFSKKELVSEDAVDKTYITVKFSVDCELIWHDALTGIKIEQREYYLSMMRRGHKLTETPKHLISTIHGAKGMEADNVVLLSIMGANTHDAYLKCKDDEQRVFYVGATRAKHNLFIVDNQTPRSFKFPHI